MTPVRHVKAMTEQPELPQADTRALQPVIHGKFTLEPNGLTVEGRPQYEEWAELGGVLAVMECGLAFLVGDWLRYGEDRYGEQAAQVIDARSWSPETVRAYRWLADKVPVENRMLHRGLTIKHHMVVAALPVAQQRKWLREALNNGGEPWTVARLKAAIRDGGDQPVTAWYILVDCGSQRKRDELLKQLELDGHTCRSVERRGRK